MDETQGGSSTGVGDTAVLIPWNFTASVESLYQEWWGWGELSQSNDEVMSHIARIWAGVGKRGGERTKEKQKQPGGNTLADRYRVDTKVPSERKKTKCKNKAYLKMY